MKTMIIATKNKGKLKEFKALLPNFHLIDLEELGYQDEIEENGKTFEENALIKAKTIYERYHLPVISDDSGLEVDALNGAPGVFSARYCGRHDADANNQLLAKNMHGVENRKARFICTICIYQEDGQYQIIRDTCEGMILEEPRGTNGFGYDPYFYVEEFHKSFAELTLEEKNEISHRAKALKQLKKLLFKILVISDSHSYALNQLSLEPYIACIHCGDYGNQGDYLKENQFYFVRGNCDFEGEKMEILKLFGKRILITHGDMQNVKYRLDNLFYLAQENEVDICLFGHTHRQECFMDNHILFLNPGSYPSYAELTMDGVYLYYNGKMKKFNYKW